jgi:2-amino-4-hydroxy-6-hydroxymethyldihydropteridine diphosphokinase
MNAADWVFIAFGSNLGDSAGAIRAAMDRLQEWSNQPVLKSSLWRSTPVDCPPGSPAFINAVAGIWPHARETPESLLARLQLLERESGRQPKRVPNEPRPLDLDLITFRSVVMMTPHLTLPHPRAHLRRFVLQPLSEIAPELVLPLQRKTVRELLGALRTDEVLVAVQ